ncbi:MAG: glutathione synthase [Desulforhopalus sp.]|jgi:glutathione synthase
MTTAHSYFDLHQTKEALMAWLVVLDPIDGLAPKTDTSLALINEARRQGIDVDTATIGDLFFERHAAVLATDSTNTRKEKRLGDYKLILMRKEPPYDLAFHYATHLLSLSGTLIVNSATSLRNFNEKLIALPFKKYMPPTLVSSSAEIIKGFIARNGLCVIKSLDSFQGKSVEKIQENDTDTINAFTGNESTPAMVQQFQDRVYEGDKRVLMLGDTFIGAAMRKPKSGYHANFASSDALATTLTPKEQAAVDEIGPWMLNQGIHFSGLDFIGEQLTEINITCPTGIIQIGELDGRDLAKEIVHYFTQLSQ